MGLEIWPELGPEFIERSGGNRHQDEGGRVQCMEESEVELVGICTNIDLWVREACQRRYIHTRSGGLGCRRRKEMDKTAGQVWRRMEMTEVVKSGGENGGGHD